GHRESLPRDSEEAMTLYRALPMSTSERHAPWPRTRRTSLGGARPGRGTAPTTGHWICPYLPPNPEVIDAMPEAVAKELRGLRAWWEHMIALRDRVRSYLGKPLSSES